MRLHEDKRLFRQAVIATAQSLQIPEIYIEKDYWVTYAHVLGEALGKRSSICVPSTKDGAGAPSLPDSYSS